MLIQRKDGKWVEAEHLPTKNRYRTLLTTDFNPCEAPSVEELKTARTYISRSSAQRAVRKYRGKKY